LALGERVCRQRRDRQRRALQVFGVALRGDGDLFQADVLGGLLGGRSRSTGEQRDRGRGRADGVFL